MRKIIFVFAFLFTISYQVNAQWIDLSANLPTSIVNISDICFLSDSIGLISSKDQSIFPYNQRFIYRTSDAGESWVEVFHDSANQQKNYSFNFINSDTGYAFSQNILLKTIDAGQSWIQIGLPVESTPFVLTVLSAHFINNNIGWVGGRLIINDPPYFSWNDVIYRTTDAGMNWSGVLTNQAVQGINKIFFAPGNRGYATDSEIFYRSSNGINWAQIGFIQTSDFIFTSQSIGWIVGYNGSSSVISKTTNGGSTWIQQYTLPDTALKRLFFTNSMTIVCVGDHGKILQTSDGGVNWNNENIGTDCNLSAISFFNEQIGYCGGQNYLFKTTNGGLTFIADEKNNLTQPKEFYLSPNYPNPFNPSTSIQYAISSRQFVTLRVYEVLGKEIATLVNEEKSAGNYETEFNASYLASGIYYYQLRAGDYVETKKMILMK